MGENMELALNLLLTGIVIVFAVLVVLILIIKIYGGIVQAVSKPRAKKKKKNEDIKPAPTTVKVSKAQEPAPVADGEVPGEIVAVIAAAVSTLYGEKSVKIKSVTRSRSSASAWRNAGLLDNTKPF